MSYTLEQKISSLCIYGFEGTTPQDVGVQTIKKQIQDLKIGGVIFYGRNVVSPEQTKILTAYLQDAESKPFLSIDQEGGQVQRLTFFKGFKGGPCAIEIAENDIDKAYHIYCQMAAELKECGFNFNYAPDVDLHLTDEEGSVIGPFDRSYGKDPAKVTAYGLQWINALHQYSIINSIKHFPGHGSATKDSHAGFVDVTNTWDEIELKPFYELINQHKVDTIMTAHIYNKKLDADHPATFSASTLNMLRQKGYQGIIISDDLHMGAVLQHFKIHTFLEIDRLKDAVIAALTAGNDMMIFSQNPLAAKTMSDFKIDMYLPEKVVSWVKSAIEQGKINESTIDGAFQKVMQLKQRI